MADDLFLITGGGTGAKVAEALVHLCAAGLGPKRVHLLLIDSDTANGNLKRAAKTVEVYQGMQRWPWSVQANVKLSRFKSLIGKGELEWLSLFGTEIQVHQITDSIDTMLNGGIETAVSSPEMHRVLDLLYDEAEQKDKCDDGFRARPNLGCLLMTDHLNAKLRTRAGTFLESMKQAAGSSAFVPVVVTASVFGGTGAAVLPIIRGCVERALRGSGAGEAVLSHLRWSAVKLLPHYQPAKKEKSVDPDRYLLDTASALQYYATVYETTEQKGRFDAMYLIGSDEPGRNRVKTVLGHSGQANPGYFEEVIAALAAFHFAERVGETDSLPMRVYEPDRLTWASLPFDDTETIQMNLAYLLHLAAFYLRRGDTMRRRQMTLGMALFMRSVDESDIRAYPWYQEILDGWAQQVSEKYRNADPSRRVGVLRSTASMQDHSLDAMSETVAEYFGRLLLWGDSALRDDNLPLFDYTSNADYAGLHDAMSKITAREVSVRRSSGEAVEIQPSDDNALVRLLRTGMSALVHHHKHNERSKPLNDPVKLVDENNDRIYLNTTMQQTKDTLHELGLGTIIEEYTRTRLVTTNGAP